MRNSDEDNGMGGTYLPFVAGIDAFLDLTSECRRCTSGQHRRQ
ncbi:MAG: hypothetical protein AAFN70_13455 [Planctomycetota bacterium]